MTLVAELVFRLEHCLAPVLALGLEHCLGSWLEFSLALVLCLLWLMCLFVVAHFGVEFSKTGFTQPTEVSLELRFKVLSLGLL